MHRYFSFLIGMVGGYHAWVAFLKSYAASSDVSVRGAIFWLGGMALPIPIALGAFSALLADYLIVRIIKRYGSK